MTTGGEDKKRFPSFVRIERPARARGPAKAGAGKAPIEEKAGERQPRKVRPPAEPEPDDPELHTRVVIPRQERRGPAAGERTDADIELREVRYGTASRMPYLRIVPRQRLFIRVAPGALEATVLASRPRDILGRYWADIKRVVIGSPFATSQAIRERLSKTKALAVLGSDPLSSSAYATEAMLAVLLLAGSGALTRALPIGAVIAALLVIVAVSYRQTIRAYPGGGGAYTVAHENLGRGPGLVAAAALLVDYVLLVAVSAAAGVAAITSAAEGLLDFRVPMAVGIVALLTLGNLRGVRESGTLFAAPTYLFIVAMLTMIVVGMVKVLAGDAPGSLLHGAPAREQVAATQGLTLFLVLRAFSSGGAALTGVEAISNGTPTFKPPESANARTTLTVMATVAIVLFLGVTYLSSRFALVPQEDETLVSLLGRDIFGENALYYGYQVATALVLFLAANTSFHAFPLLSAVLARDRLMPRQFEFRGDRLTYSNGIVLLAAVACLMLVVFGADVTDLIPLYAVGVFVSFTLSQSGMVRHWWRYRESGWRASLAVNGFGAVATGAVAIIIGVTKFTHGAWISILIMMIMVVVYILIRRYYEGYEEEVRLEKGALLPGIPKPVPLTGPAQREHIVIPVGELDAVSAAAITFARKLTGRKTAVHITDSRGEAEQFRILWEEEVPDVPLLVIESPYRALVAPMLAYVDALERTEPDSSITVVLSIIVPRYVWERPLQDQAVLRLKPQLEKRRRVRTVVLPYRLGQGGPA